MKQVASNIVLFEKDDTVHTVVQWLYQNTDIKRYHFNEADWVHTLKEGDTIVLNDPEGKVATFKLNVNMLTESEQLERETLSTRLSEISTKEVQNDKTE